MRFFPGSQEGGKVSERIDRFSFLNSIETQRQELVGVMCGTIHKNFAKLDDDVVVSSAHGAGSLCGKSILKAVSSAIGYEKQHNYAFWKRTKSEFVNLLLSDLAFIPKYFLYSVGLNIQGAPDLAASRARIPYLPRNYQ